MSKQASKENNEDYLLSRPQAGYYIYGQGHRRSGGEHRLRGIPDLTGYLLASDAGGAPLTARRVLRMLAKAVVIFQYGNFCVILCFALYLWFFFGFNPSLPFCGLFNYTMVVLGDFGIVLIFELPLTLVSFVWLVSSDE